MYINNLSCRLSSTTKLFADDTSLFSVVNDVTQSTNKLNDDLDKISNWAYQWKISFHPDKSKQGMGNYIFSYNSENNSSPVIFYNMAVVCSFCQKHLRIYLNEKLNFPDYIKEKSSKANKGIYRYPKEIIQCPTKKFCHNHL